MFGRERNKLFKRSFWEISTSYWTTFLEFTEMVADMDPRIYVYCLGKFNARDFPRKENHLDIKFGANHHDWSKKNTTIEKEQKKKKKSKRLVQLILAYYG